MVSSAGMSLINRTFKENKELQQIYDENRILEPLITNELDTMSKVLGTDFEGLEFSVKSASSVEDKIKRDIVADLEKQRENEELTGIKPTGKPSSYFFKNFSDSICCSSNCMRSA